MTDASSEEQARRTAILSALTTEHFVLQTATGTTYTEANARSSLYVMALSSSLVAMGFPASSREAFIPFAASIAASGPTPRATSPPSAAAGPRPIRRRRASARCWRSSARRPA